jgi:TM2 domain-containing membrane protein YozV
MKMEEKMQKSKFVALLLCFFFGYLGFHRFYVGKVGTGLLWLITGGLFGVGAFIDFFVILFGGFKDSNGQPLA